MAQVAAYVILALIGVWWLMDHWYSPSRNARSDRRALRVWAGIVAAIAVLMLIIELRGR